MRGRALASGWHRSSAARPGAAASARTNRSVQSGQVTHSLVAASSMCTRARGTHHRVAFRRARGRSLGARAHPLPEAAVKSQRLAAQPAVKVALIIHRQRRVELALEQPLDSAQRFPLGADVARALLLERVELAPDARVVRPPDGVPQRLPPRRAAAQVLPLRLERAAELRRAKGVRRWPRRRRRRRPGVGRRAGGRGRGLGAGAAAAQCVPLRPQARVLLLCTPNRSRRSTEIVCDESGRGLGRTWSACSAATASITTGIDACSFSGVGAALVSDGDGL